MKEKKVAVLFDLDGTLWDSSREVLLCWNQVLSPLGRHIGKAEMDRLMGLTPREIADVQFPDLPPEERETLLRLKERYFIGLVSNCTEDYALAFLHAHALASLFDDHETAGRTGLDKGENISLLLRRNRIERAIYVGDTAKDLAAARAAHIPFLFASWGFGTVPEDQLAASNFSMVPEIASSILGF